MKNRSESKGTLFKVNGVNCHFFDQFSIKNNLPPLGSYLGLEKCLYFSCSDSDQGSLNSQKFLENGISHWFRFIAI
jgi:hypothetical protein